MQISVSVPHALAYGADECQPSKVVGQDVLDAFYNTVHGYPGGASALAVRMGMSPNTLTHKANPNTTTHQPNPRELIAAMQFTSNHSVLHAIAEAVGYTCTRATPAQAEGDPVDTLMRLQCQVADFVRAVAEPVGMAQPVNSNQMRRADFQAQELIAAIGHTLAMLRGRMRAAPESAAS